MLIRNILLGRSIRYKIIMTIYATILLISIILGFVSYKISADNIVNKVSVANLGTVRQIDSNINFLHHEIDDISMQLELHNMVQSFLNKQENPLYLDKSLLFTMSLIATKSYINVTILYGLNDNSIPYHSSNDGSNGIYPFSSFANSAIYKKIHDLKGKPLWFRLDGENQVFIQNNKFPKVAMARMVRDLNDYHDIGLLIMCVNEAYIRNMYADNLQTNQGSVAIVDENGNMISHGGPDFYPENQPAPAFIKQAAAHTDGSIVETIAGKPMLITYSSSNYMGWKIFYTVPMNTLTKELNDIKLITFYIVIGCLIVLLPFMLLISSLLTAPIKRLLKSMRSFQEGNFEERVVVHNLDEIGQLSAGYNDMVANIKELINSVYVSQIREREAELDALQAQINPHFLYNTLDIIFWKAQASGDKEISTMIYSLSKLFRLSLNRGEGITIVAREKELIEHYLLLQKMRFKNKLSYVIDLDDRILSSRIPKLILQPFVENAILHGLEKKKTGGHVVVSGVRHGDQIQFVIEDDGVGMDEASLQKLFLPKEEQPVSTSPELVGGYAVRNVNERLQLIYGGSFRLNFISEKGRGTRVEITLPARDSTTLEG